MGETRSNALPSSHFSIKKQLLKKFIAPIFSLTVVCQLTIHPRPFTICQPHQPHTSKRCVRVKTRGPCSVTTRSSLGVTGEQLKKVPCPLSPKNLNVFMTYIFGDVGEILLPALLVFSGSSFCVYLL